MSGPLPSGRRLGLPMEPGEMPGMPQPPLASCNLKSTRQFHLKQPRTVQQDITKIIRCNVRRYKHMDNAIKWSNQRKGESGGLCSLASEVECWAGQRRVCSADGKRASSSRRWRHSRPKSNYILPPNSSELCTDFNN